MADMVKLGLLHSRYYHIRSFLRGSRRKRLLILMYHDLRSDSTASADSVADDRPNGLAFDCQIRAILRDFRAVTVEEAIREIDEHGDLLEDSVAITFDDGYQSVYEVAWPIMRKYGVLATVYLATDWIDGKAGLWWNDLEELIKIGDLSKLDTEEFCREFQINPAVFGRTPPNEPHRKSLLNRLSFDLMKKPTAIQKGAVEYLRRSVLVDPATKLAVPEPLDWDQIRLLAAQGIEFGAHTRSHPNLSYVETEDAYAEIAGSKAVIESQIQKKITGFAYPYGYDVAGYSRFQPMLKEIGFTYACLSWWGCNTARTNRYLLFRNLLPPLNSIGLLRREILLNFNQKSGPSAKIADLSKEQSGYRP